MNWVFYMCLLVPCCELLRAQGDFPLVNTTNQTTTREATNKLPTTDKVITSTYASTDRTNTTEPISEPSTTEQIIGVTTDPSNDQTSTDKATTQPSTSGEGSETTIGATISQTSTAGKTPRPSTTGQGGGASPTIAANDKTTTTEATTDPPDDGDVVAPGVLGSLLGVTVAAFIVYVVWTRVKQRRHNPGDEAVQPIDEIELTVIGVRMGPEGVDSMVYADTGLPEWASKWEILWSNLVVEEQVLGRGNFGEVKKGTVKKDGKEIQSAIKMLKGQASDRDQKDFMDEFRTMSVIGYHLNVVSLLGACQHQDVLYVALEFLPNGDLHSYLTGLVNSNTAHILTSTKLVKFALDVARGMKHLSDLGVIHRDLAARNILLGEALIAKVSDFGLSREQNIYVQTSTRCVPARWLAIESLKHKTYTTQSDVWSFGIVLWEIATLGGVPYPDIMSRALAGKLEEGYRMPKPGNCHRDIYSLMCLCWDEDPNKRPTFTHLVSHLSKMDANKIRHTYMEVDRTHYENVMRHDIDDN